MPRPVVVLAVAALFASCSKDSSEGSTWKGVLQLGTSADDSAQGVALDTAGNLFVVGSTSGTLADVDVGVGDAFVTRYDPSGKLVWARQFGTRLAADGGFGRAVAVDSTGNVVVATFWPALLVKYDLAGNLVWIREGVPGYGLGVATAVAMTRSGEILVAGGVTRAADNDGYVAKYDRDGNRLWASAFGTMNTSDGAAGIALDASGGIFVVGSTTDAGGTDALLGRYDSAGTQLWVRRVGTSAVDVALAVAVDGSGNALVAGGTEGVLAASQQGGRDAFVAKYDASGVMVWAAQLGTSLDDCAAGIAVDTRGDVLVVGSTYGSLGSPNADASSDSFIAKLDPSGNQLWVRQLGTSGADFGNGVAVDGAGSVFTVGSTQGSLGGTNRGQQDAFVAKYSPEGTLQ